MKTGTKHVIRLIALVLVVSLGACNDSGPQDQSTDDASALFVGDWNLTDASDDNGNQLNNLAQNYTSITASFDGDSSFVIDLDSFSEEASDVHLEGTFTATESTTLLRLSTEVENQPVSLTFNYDFGGVDSTEFAISSTTSQTVVMNSAFGTSFSGPTTLTFTYVEQ